MFNTVWPEILAGNLFWRIGNFQSNLPIFHPPKSFTVWCHHYCKIIAFMCTRPAARRATLIVGIEFTIQSCVRGNHSFKEFCTPDGWEKSWLVCQREEAKAIQTMCTRLLWRSTRRKQSRLSVTMICSVAFHHQFCPNWAETSSQPS